MGGGVKRKSKRKGVPQTGSARDPVAGGRTDRPIFGAVTAAESGLIQSNQKKIIDGLLINQEEKRREEKRREVKRREEKRREVK